MAVAKIARQRFLDDVTDAVGQVFLGHMLQCAKCHDHKFDPVPARDYYSIQAAFATTQFAERKAAYLSQENTTGFDADTHPQHQELAARMEAYELAFRMQMEVPGILDIDKEDAHTLDLYGIGSEPTNAFGRRCLLARRLVEQGVRFVQLYADTWDSHDYIERAHGNLIRS